MFAIFGIDQTEVIDAIDCAICRSDWMRLILKYIRFILCASAKMWEGKDVTIPIKRTIFFVRALMASHSLRPFLNAPSDKSLGKLLQQRPQIIGVVVWSYQCTAWNAKTRLAKIVDHCSVMDEIGRPLDFPVDSYIELLGLSEIYQGLRVIISQPAWLFRDGLLTMHLFDSTQMIYSLSFSFFHHGNDRAAFIGQIQGEKSDRARGRYRELTRVCGGMRPRDLLIEIFCIFCSTIAVKHVFSVAEEYRRQRYRYFFKNGNKVTSANYNTIWEDQGGVAADKLSYRLDVERRRRSDRSIGASKRRMYRRRFAMLDRIEAQMHERLLLPLICRHEESDPFTQTLLAVSNVRSQPYQK